jgi:hypothetical protein
MAQGFRVGLFFLLNLRGLEEELPVTFDVVF